MQNIVFAGLLIGAAALSGCTEGVLDPKGPIASAELQILFDATGIMLAIVIPTMIATLGVAWWFRASNPRAHYLPDFAYSGRLELLVWSIPIMTVLLVGGVAALGSYELDPPKPIASQVKPLRVQVVSLDWKWLFIYPEQRIATVNQLVVPAGTPVNFKLTSATVWNTFFVPQMGSMIYTMPRMATRLNLMADRQGVFPGRSAHFSGDGFPGKEFNVHSVAPAQFNARAARARGAGPVLDGRAYAELSKPTSYVKPMTYSAVAPGLFDAIVSGKPPPTQQLPHNPQAEGPAG